MLVCYSLDINNSNHNKAEWGLGREGAERWVPAMCPIFGSEYLARAAPLATIIANLWKCNIELVISSRVKKDEITTQVSDRKVKKKKTHSNQRNEFLTWQTQTHTKKKTIKNFLTEHKEGETKWTPAGTKQRTTGAIPIHIFPPPPTPTHTPSLSLSFSLYIYILIWWLMEMENKKQDPYSPPARAYLSQGLAAPHLIKYALCEIGNRCKQENVFIEDVVWW